MGKKRDMYIDYGNSYKNRGRKSKNQFWFTVIVILILILLGYLFYSALRERITSYNKKQNSAAAPTLTVTPAASPTPVLSPTTSLTPSPVPQPTITPVEAANSNHVAGVSNENENAGTPKNIKGIYIPAKTAGSDSMDKLLDIADRTEINAMVIDVKDDYGKISYQMDCALAKEIGSTTNNISDITALVSKLKQKNIYLIARIVAFKDPYLAEKRKDLAVKNKDGTMYRDNNGEGWVNPYNKEIWEYLYNVASGAAAAGFDEIQFDYIRFSTGDGIEKADFGEAAKKESKESIITGFTKYIYNKLKPLGVYVSADVFGAIINSNIDAGLVGQNYVDMAKNLDFICPMIYPSHFGKGNYGIMYPDLEPYNIIHKVLEASKLKLSKIPKTEHCAAVRPWLQDFTAKWVKPHLNYGGPELRQEINGVYSVGYSQWLLWNSGCAYSEDGLKKK